MNYEGIIKKAWDMESNPVYSKRVRSAYLKGANEVLNQLGMDMINTKEIDSLSRGKFSEYYLELLMNGSIKLTFVDEDEANSFVSSVLSKYPDDVSTRRSKDKLTITAKLNKELV